MGWTAHDLPNEEWQLWTRGGAEGVYIKNRSFSEKIKIPAELLRMLVADDIRSHGILKFQSMEDDEILGLDQGNDKS